MSIKYESKQQIEDIFNKILKEIKDSNGELQTKINKLEEENNMLKGMFKKSIK